MMFAFLDWVRIPSPQIVTLSAILALLVGGFIAAFPSTWKYTRLLATWVHEASHALAAILTGRRVRSMSVHADTSGVTEHVGRERGLGRMLTTMAGYPGPALVGLALVSAVAAERLNYALAGLLILSILLLPIQRSWRGLWLTVLVGTVMIVTINFGNDPKLVSYGTLILAGYLLVASPRTIIELHGVRKDAKSAPPTTEEGDDSAHSDADALAAQTFLPAIVWEAIFAAISLWAIWVSISALANA